MDPEFSMAFVTLEYVEHTAFVMLFWCFMPGNWTPSAKKYLQTRSNSVTITMDKLRWTKNFIFKSITLSFEVHTFPRDMYVIVRCLSRQTPRILIKFMRGHGMNN